MSPAVASTPPSPQSPTENKSLDNLNIVLDPKEEEIVEETREKHEELKIEEEPKKSAPNTPEIISIPSSIPPPPPQFANNDVNQQMDQNDDHKLEQRSRKSSKDSIARELSDDTDTRVQFRNSRDKLVSQHPDIRRSISVDDKSSSAPSSPTITANNRLNTSTITINTDANQIPTDKSNSLASQNVTQVTVVTSHPPVIIDNSNAPTPIKQSGGKKLSKSLSLDTSSMSMSNEVVIVSNEMNKSQHVHESSTDDDYQSYDSLESSPKYNNSNKKLASHVMISSGGKGGSKSRPRKLDESEVMIVSPDGIFEEDLISGDEIDQKTLLDTSHVSVVTVGDEQIKVKDSSNILDSNSDLSNASMGGGGVSGDSGEDRIEFVTPHTKTNGQIIYNSKRSSSSREDSDVNIIVNSGRSGSTGMGVVKKRASIIEKRVSPDSSVDCSSSMDSPTRPISENGSMRSSNRDDVSTKHHGMTTSNSINNKMIDRSDAESISTTTSHDSREMNEDLGEVQLRRKDPLPEIIVANPPSPKRPTRTKEEIQLANLKKKTRKRTRKFEIDGVQVTTTTSKVIYGDDEENGRLYDDHIFRKQELRELKLLQKQEKKQFYDLQGKETVAKEQQDKKFEQERIALERTYDADMDVLARQHKQTVEKYEAQQENELRNTSKKIRMEQERELKLVRICCLIQDFHNL